MKSQQLLVAFLVGIFVVGLAFAALPISYAEGTSIFGYPYYTTQAGGSGTIYDVHGSRFTLNGDADITSISCLMDGGFSPTSPHDSYIYRFAIYSDNNGKVGTLISQTETGTFIGTEGGSQDIWNTANFAQATHLSCGKYWLMAVHNASQYITIHTEYPAANYTTATCPIGGMDFTTTLSSPIYTPDYVLCLYASGTGSSSVPPPITDPNHQQVSRLTVGCTTDSSSATSKIEITGNLTANKVGIPSAPIILSYADNPNATWHEISTANTAADGSFKVAWYPTGVGSYVINATYSGDSTYTAETALVNVIVTSAADKSHTVFSVDSNSTVSNLGFNSETGQLSFSVSGESGSTGYAEIYIAKSLVDDASKIHASIDGETADFTVSSMGDAWVLYFSYHHSSHNIVFTLDNENVVMQSPAPSATANSSPAIPELTLPLVIIVLAALVAAILAIKYRKR